MLNKVVQLYIVIFARNGKMVKFKDFFLNYYISINVLVKL